MLYFEKPQRFVTATIYFSDEAVGPTRPRFAKPLVLRWNALKKRFGDETSSVSRARTFANIRPSSIYGKFEFSILADQYDCHKKKKKMFANVLKKKTFHHARAFWALFRQTDKNEKEKKASDTDQKTKPRADIRLYGTYKI